MHLRTSYSVVIRIGWHPVGCMTDDALMEDPVTGSAQTTLIPYWAARPGKKKLIAKRFPHGAGILNVNYKAMGS